MTTPGRTLLKPVLAEPGCPDCLRIRTSGRVPAVLSAWSAEETPLASLVGLEIDAETEVEVTLSVHGSASLLLGPLGDDGARWRKGLPALFPSGVSRGQLVPGVGPLMRWPNHACLLVHRGRVASAWIEHRPFTL